jgi:transitional endoplasmic reticulum ATPase
VQYCEYWRHKLRSNKNVEFPKEMSSRIADITDLFSFAYMKEAFVAALLVIVRSGGEKPGYPLWDDDLSGNILWKELKKQIENLRREMEGEDDSAKNSASQLWPGLNALNSVLGENKTPPIDVNAMPMYK